MQISEASSSSSFMQMLLVSMGVAPIDPTSAIRSIRSLYPDTGASIGTGAAAGVAVINFSRHLMHLRYLASVLSRLPEGPPQLLATFPLLALVDPQQWTPHLSGLGGDVGEAPSGPLRPANQLLFSLEGSWGDLQGDALSAGMAFVHPKVSSRCGSSQGCVVFVIPKAEGESTASKPPVTRHPHRVNQE